MSIENTIEELVDPEHPLIKLGGQINWKAFEQELGATYHEGMGAPGVNTRLMVALHYLKYRHDLGDEEVLERWVENIYWQRFSAERYLQYEAPLDSSSMTRWATRSTRCSRQRR